MNDEKLKHAWRAATAEVRGDAGSTMDADALTELSEGPGSVERRDALLAAAGESALNADLLAVLRALRLDAQSLADEVQLTRRPNAAVAGKRPRQRRWLALAASMAAIAVTVTALRYSAPSMPADETLAPATTLAPAASVLLPQGDTQIMAASFDERAQPTSPPQIFVGDFDS